EANGAMRLAVTLRVNAAPSGAVKMGVGAANLPITAPLQAAGAGYAQIAVPLSCFKGQDLSKTPTVLRLETAGTLDVSISDVRLTEAQGDGACPAD
ncbi:MAG TPA: putative glycoside hydrolase, partial [Asticcacaulis sp.]